MAAEQAEKWNVHIRSAKISVCIPFCWATWRFQAFHNVNFGESFLVIAWEAHLPRWIHNCQPVKVPWIYWHHFRLPCVFSSLWHFPNGIRVIKRVHMIFTPFENVQCATGFSHISCLMQFDAHEYYVVTFISWEFARQLEKGEKKMRRTELNCSATWWIMKIITFHAMSRTQFHCQVFFFLFLSTISFSSASSRPPYVWSEQM